MDDTACRYGVPLALFALLFEAILFGEGGPVLSLGHSRGIWS